MALGGKMYSVGGDDMRLYYIFPEKYLKNFVFNIATDNTLAGAQTGYYSVAYFAPMLFVIYLLKKVFFFLNVQYLMYGFNLSLGFLFMYLFLGTIVEGKKRIYKGFKIVAGLFYIFSPYLLNTLYQTQLLGIYLVSIVPCVFYFFARGIKQNNYKFTVASVLIFSIFSTTFNTSPYSSAFIICSLPVVYYLFSLNKRIFIKQSVILVFSFILLNFYWIFHEVFAQISSLSLPNSISQFSSGAFVADNNRIIKFVSTIYSPINQPFNQMTRGDLSKASPSFYINYPVILLLGLSLIFSYKLETKIKRIYFLTFLSLLLSWFLFSPNFGSWGPYFFDLLNKVVPFWGVFRNMYDKFAFSLAFYYSLALYVALVASSKVRLKAFLGVLLGIFVVVDLFNIGKYINLHKSETLGTSRFSGTFNLDFISLVDYLGKVNNPSRILWLPLNFPTYLNIEDGKYPGNYYTGLSPLRELADRSDYVGKFSFMTLGDIFLGDKLIYELLSVGKYQQAGEMFQQMNVKYIVIDKHTIPQSFQEYFYGEGNLWLSFQNQDLKDEILGTKLADFGERYSLYEISRKYDNDKLYLTDNLGTFPDNFEELSYQKVSSGEYNINIKTLKSPIYLVFLEPFNNNWQIQIRDAKESFVPIKNIEHGIFSNYANWWILDPSFLISELGENSGENISLKIYFKPEIYSKYAEFVSLFSFILLGFFIISDFLKNRFKKKLKFKL